MDWTCCGVHSSPSASVARKRRGVLNQQPMAGRHGRDAPAIQQVPDHHRRIIRPARLAARWRQQSLPDCSRTVFGRPSGGSRRQKMPAGIFDPPCRASSRQSSAGICSMGSIWPSAVKRPGGLRARAAIIVAAQALRLGVRREAITRAGVEREFQLAVASTVSPWATAGPASSNFRSPESAQASFGCRATMLCARSDVVVHQHQHGILALRRFAPQARRPANPAALKRVSFAPSKKQG